MTEEQVKKAVEVLLKLYGKQNGVSLVKKESTKK